LGCREQPAIPMIYATFLQRCGCLQATMGIIV
jgi:hypothetical protein